MRKANTYSAISDKINITTIKSLIDPKIDILSNSSIVNLLYNISSFFWNINKTLGYGFIHNAEMKFPRHIEKPIFSHQPLWHHIYIDVKIP